MERKNRKRIRLFLTFLLTISMVVSLTGVPVFGTPTYGPNWYPVVTHCHSTYSAYPGADSGLWATWKVDGILKDLDKNLVEGACNISDHVGQIGSPPWADPSFKDTDSDGDGHYIIPVRGEEWGAQLDTNANNQLDTETGHATIFNIGGDNRPIYVKPVIDLEPPGWFGIRPRGQINMATYSNMLSEAESRGALVWANHPCNGYPWLPKDKGWTRDANGDGDYTDPGDWFCGIEGRMIGTEVWTWSWIENNNDNATGWWQSLLTQCKRKIVGTASSDFHNNLEAALLGPYMIAYAASTSPADMGAAIKAGKLIMRKDQVSPYVILQADANGDGAYETQIGDTIPVTDSKTVKFRLLYFGDDCNDFIKIYTKSGMINTNTVGSSSWVSTKSSQTYQWTYDFSMTYQAADKDFVRVELIQSNSVQSPDAMTNPIYINVF